jgi:hypothetical protein
LKAKGVTMQQLFTERHWHVLSFESLAGVYGYMTIFSPKFYYRMLGSLYLLLMFYIAFAVIKKPGRRSISQFAITAFCIGLCILMSLFLSWTYAFQAQGRYLFPALPISATFIYANRRSFNNLFVNGLVFAAFLLSVYSFVFVALPRINL